MYEADCDINTYDRHCHTVVKADSRHMCCCHAGKPYDNQMDSLKLSLSLNSIVSKGSRGANLFQSFLGEAGRSDSSEVSGAEVLHFKCTGQHASAQRAVSQEGYSKLPACWHQVFL